MGVLCMTETKYYLDEEDVRTLWKSVGNKMFLIIVNRVREDWYACGPTLSMYKDVNCAWLKNEIPLKYIKLLGYSE